MAQLTWGDEETKRYVYGVDRGVLHGQTSDLVVPWNGLTKVSESEASLSGTASAFDGYEYVALMHRSFYEADVEAFSFPDTLKAINGEVDALPGFILTGQDREQADFSYRTFDNETDYKIHFVWNAIFSLKSKSRDTVSDDLEALTFKWKVATNPPASDYWYRTSHMIIDSSTLDPEILVSIEDALYGTDLTIPGFPTQSEILFAVQ